MSIEGRQILVISDIILPSAVKKSDIWVGLVAAPACRRLGSVLSEEADLYCAAVCHSVLMRLSGCTCFCDSVFGLDLAFLWSLMSVLIYGLI